MWNSFRKTDNPYDDLDAFERWMSVKAESAGLEHWQTVWENMDILERIGIYSIMCDVISQKESNDERSTTENSVS